MVRMAEVSRETLSLQFGKQVAPPRSLGHLLRTMEEDTPTASVQSRRTTWISLRNASSRHRCALWETHNGFRNATTHPHAPKSRLCAQTPALIQLVHIGHGTRSLPVVALGVVPALAIIARTLARSSPHRSMTLSASLLSRGTSLMRCMCRNCLPETM